MQNFLICILNTFRQHINVSIYINLRSIHYRHWIKDFLNSLPTVGPISISSTPPKWEYRVNRFVHPIYSTERDYKRIEITETKLILNQPAKCEPIQCNIIGATNVELTSGKAAIAPCIYENPEFTWYSPNAARDRVRFLHVSKSDLPNKQYVSQLAFRCISSIAFTLYH